MSSGKRFLCLLLAVCLLAGGLIFPQRAMAASVYFSAVNDTLLELSSASMPAYIGGTLYVPYTMFNNGTLGVYFSYDRTAQMVSLLYGGQQIYFNMASGETFDAEGNSYTATAAYYNGKIYLPVSFTCGFFGFSYSYISSEGLGAIVRVKDSNVVLSDATFEKAARSLMSDRLNKYLGSTTPGPSSEPTPSPSEEPKDYTNIRIYLGFTGLSGAGDVLDSLAGRSMRVTFFVRSGEIRENPDLIRRILCEGHSLGIDLAEGTDVEETAGLLFTAARCTTLLVSGGEAPAGYVQCLYDRDVAAGGVDSYSLRSAASRVQRSLSVHFDCTKDAETLAAFLNYLEEGKFQVLPFDELSVGI